MMFVPRAVRLKGVKEVRQSRITTAPPKSPKCTGGVDHEDALVEAMKKTSTNSPAPQLEKIDSRTGPGITTAQATREFVAQLAAGIELIFTDYALQEDSRVTWLERHYRTLPEGDRCTLCVRNSPRIRSDL